MKKLIYAFIPRFIPNALVILFFECLCFFQRDPNKITPCNEKHNQTLWETYGPKLQSTNDYIEYQNQYTDLRFGKVTVMYAACEIIACYNAIQYFEKKPLIPFPKMISAFESHGMALSGRFGSSPKAVYRYLIKQGFQCSFSTKTQTFAAILGDYDCVILSYFNDKNDIRRGVHTITLTKENGVFFAHNLHCNGKVYGPYVSMMDFASKVNQGNTKVISLIGIQK